MEDLNLSYIIGDTHNLIENNMHGKMLGTVPGKEQVYQNRFPCPSFFKHILMVFESPPQLEFIAFLLLTLNCDRSQCCYKVWVKCLHKVSAQFLFLFSGFVCPFFLLSFLSPPSLLSFLPLRRVLIL